MPTSKIVRTSIEAASPRTIKVLAVMTTEALFFAGLNARTARDLVKYPPIDSEPIRNMGIPLSTGADRIRIWINNDFRVPAKMKKLVSGEVTPKTTYSALKTLAGIK